MKRFYQFSAVIMTIGGIWSIPALYLVATHYLPGTINELVIIVSLSIMLAIGWNKYEYLIPDYFKTLNIPGAYLIGQIITVGVYAMILLFADKHGSNIEIPAYYWIITVTAIILMDSIFMKKRHLWVEKVFELTTALFLLSMFQNHGSPYIWLISAPYIIIMLKISYNKEIFTNENTKLIISAAIILACITLTTVQFWASITAFITYRILGVSIWMYASSLVIFGLIIRIARSAKKRHEEKNRKIQEKMAQEKLLNDIEMENAAIKQENIRRLENAIKEFQEKQSWTLAMELISLTGLMDTKQTTAFQQLLITMPLIDLVTVSETKKQLVWNDEQLRQAIKTIDDIAYRNYDDNILRKILHQYDAFENFINSHVKYVGHEQLMKRMSTYFGNVRSFKALI